MTFEVRLLDPLDIRYLVQEAAEEHARPYLAGIEFEHLSGGFIGLLDGKTVGCAGVKPIYGPGSIRAVAWALLFPTAKQCFIAVHRAMKRQIEESPFERIEAHTDVAFSAANRWAELLGFKPEGPPMSKWFPNGATAQQWVIFK